MNQPNCSSCRQFNGCQSPLTCQVPECEPARKPLRYWPAIAISTAVALAACLAAALFLIYGGKP